MGRKAVVVLAAAVAMSWSVAVRADSLSTMGASSRGTAMGGAMVAIADGWEAAYYNASALALSRNSSSFQYDIINGALKVNTDDRLKDGWEVKAGINHRFLRDRIGVGLILSVSNRSLDLASLDSVIGSVLGGGGAPNWTWQQYTDSTTGIFPTIGVGFRITNWLAVGVTGSQKTGLISMGYFPLIVDPILNALIGLDTGIIYSNLHGYGFSVGSDPMSQVTTGFNVTLRPVKYISLGYTYSPATWTRFKLRLELPGGQGSILPNPEYYLFDMKIPGSVETTSYGAAGNIPIPWNDGWLTLAWTRRIENWSGFYPRSIVYSWTAGDIFNQEWFRNYQPRNPKLMDVSSDHYGFEYTGDASPLLFWKLKELSNARFAVRGGYYHWDSPQPDVKHDWQVSMIDSDADVYSFGLGFGYDRKRKLNSGGAPARVQIDLHLQMTSLEDRNYKIQPDEYDSVPLENYLVKTSGWINQYGIQITWLQ